MKKCGISLFVSSIECATMRRKNINCVQSAIFIPIVYSFRWRQRPCTVPTVVSSPPLFSFFRFFIEIIIFSCSKEKKRKEGETLFGCQQLIMDDAVSFLAWHLMRLTSHLICPVWRIGPQKANLYWCSFDHIEIFFSSPLERRPLLQI